MKTEKNLKPSAKATVKEIKPFYVRAGLNTQSHDNAAQKIKKLYEAYKILERSSRNKNEMGTALHKARENKFVDELDDLVDIVSTDLSAAS